MFLEVLKKISESLVLWVFSHGVKILIILIVAWVLTRIGRKLVSKLVNAVIEKSEKLLKSSNEAKKQKAQTLVKIFNSSLKVVIWTIAVLTILPELGVNPAPLLASAGLLGLAIGMGARSLVQDYIAGLFILLEDQYRVGEEIDIGGTRGKVVELTLRKTTLKDNEGIVHYIPNGQIKKVSNFSRNQ